MSAIKSVTTPRGIVDPALLGRFQKRRTATLLATMLPATLLFALTCCSAPARSAEEMSEANAIAAIKRLRGHVSPALVPRDEQHGASVNPGDRNEPPALRVQLAGEQFGDEQLKVLKYIPRVTQVVLSNCAVTDAGLSVLKSLPRLTTLTFYCRQTGPSLTDAGLERISEITTLERLYLDNASISRRGFAHLAKLNALRALMAGGLGISDAAVEEISRLRTLKSLVLDDTSVTDESLASLKRLPQLEHLVLSSDALTDDGLRTVRQIPSLTSFHIRSDRLTNRALYGLEGFGRLSSLGIGGAQITDAALDPLAQLPGLTSLTLSNNASVTDAGLKRIGALVKLEWLNLYGTGISDAGLEALAALPNLTNLNLARTDVTDAGLDALKRIKTLRVVILPDGVTAEAAERFSEETGIQAPGK